MAAPAAFSGDYVDLKFIKSRKVAQVYVEIPIEQAAAFVAAFGAPNPSTGVPVALARLASEPEREAPKERRKFTDLPPSQQAAMRCNEPDFWRYLGVDCAPVAVEVVRKRLRVKSRSELDHDPILAERWRAMDDDFYAWQRGIR